MQQWKNTMIFLVVASTFLVQAASEYEEFSKNNSSSQSQKGKNWAVLVAGSYDYTNYRHQADVCHAYQVLKKGGLKDENIIVFMYDDIAYNEQNPRKGVIINEPNGTNVYPGVPKDYTGGNVSVENFFNVLLANKSGLTGGSGKVLDSGPDDHIFIFYADHGGPGVLEMADGLLFAKDFIDVLKKKYESRSYAQMVVYFEACYAGSMFEGLLSEKWNIYATTASNANEESYACYCMENGEYTDTCLGDLYSVSWIDDSETHNLNKETLEEQYLVVKKKTSSDSHVMEYGNKTLAARTFLSAFMASKSLDTSASALVESQTGNVSLSSPPYRKVAQRDVELHRHHRKYVTAADGSDEKIEASKGLITEIEKRDKIDGNMNELAKAIFGSEKRKDMLRSVRSAGEVVVDDWECLKNMLRIYAEKCGKLTTYGLKYTGLFANMCNAGTHADQMLSASTRICSGSRA